MSKTIFIYHGSCFDGFTAAWIYSRFVDRDAEFFHAKYGDAPPDVRGRDVVIADFSYPREVMFGVACEANNLTVLDHHHTAQQALDGLEKQVLVEAGKVIAVTFDMERSGAGLAWDELVDFDRTPWISDKKAWHELTGQDLRPVRPDLVAYVEDRDLWRMSLPRAHEYMANVYAAPMTFESWDALHARPIVELMSRGEGILAYMEQYGTKALAEATMEHWPIISQVPDYERSVAFCVNMPYMNCSDYLARMLAEKGGPFVASYFRRADGRWQFSLRSSPDFDVSEVAKAFGGGGHKQAAGFDVASTEEVFERKGGQ